MKRRGFFGLLAAAAAAPAVAKAAEPEAEPSFTESDYLFAVDRDNPTPGIGPVQAWVDVYDPWAPRNGKCRVAINGTEVRLYSHPVPGPLRRMEETQALLDRGVITIEQAKELAGLP